MFKRLSSYIHYGVGGTFSLGDGVFYLVFIPTNPYNVSIANVCLQVGGVILASMDINLECGRRETSIARENLEKIVEGNEDKIYYDLLEQSDRRRVAALIFKNDKHIKEL